MFSVLFSALPLLAWRQERPQFVKAWPHSTTPTPTSSRGSSPTRPTSLRGCRRVGRVGVGVDVGVVECGLCYAAIISKAI